MSIKDILVHVDLSPACDERVRLAMRLAKRFKANLIGAFGLPSSEMVAPPESGAAAIAVVTWLAELEEAAARLGQQFVANLRDAGIDGTWVAKHGPAGLEIARLARMTDLVVLGQRDPDHSTALTTPEDVVLACGRPVLMVPYAGRFDDVGENAIIAWNGSRESARAAHDGLPLLGRAKKVLVLSINPEPDQEELRDGLVRNLIHHGLDASSETHVVNGASPAEVVLSHVANIGGDLVVMGAYGHSRLRETILGGMTRDILRGMTVPVLMAH